MEPWKACCRPLFAGSHCFGEELDPGPDSITHKSEKSEIHIRIRINVMRIRNTSVTSRSGPGYLQYAPILCTVRLNC
jgi:hypothetical protein